MSEDFVLSGGCLGCHTGWRSWASGDLHVALFGRAFGFESTWTLDSVLDYQALYRPLLSHTMSSWTLNTAEMLSGPYLMFSNLNTARGLQHKCDGRWMLQPVIFFRWREIITFSGICESKQGWLLGTLGFCKWEALLLNLLIYFVICD